MNLESVAEPIVEDDFHDERPAVSACLWKIFRQDRSDWIRPADGHVAAAAELNGRSTLLGAGMSTFLQRPVASHWCW
jgi:hypothetical protein